MGKKQNIRGGKINTLQKIYANGQKTVTETTQRLRGGYSSVKFIQTYEFRQMKVTLKNFAKLF